VERVHGHLTRDLTSRRATHSVADGDDDAARADEPVANRAFLDSARADAEIGDEEVVLVVLAPYVR
jgi:hypothetical protein